MTTQTTEKKARTRKPVDLLRDTGYATIGATDAAVAYVRRLSERAERELPDLKVLRDPNELSAQLRQLGDVVEARFEALAGRGREVVESLQRKRPTRDALARARAAREQVESALTDARGAAKTAGEAVEATGEAVEAGAAAVGNGAATDYEALTVAELRELARDRGIAGYSGMHKAELIAALRKA